ncbi:hypothetical protein XI06_17690 [Bradyrhizobium sp. CCBAU 11434]|uniref:hypothetical protein n=1 Tax=Bradyrhizobium sp. CCBAU 11434 TaxID=1630885 RepID=UPI002305D41A|nr:hypothetical protein [Bradyrhizobium sp. CCBAU 11434]MDA9522072.1 hypothetical protein [Bradyrhizobium sp. CCBAU 11434]
MNFAPLIGNFIGIVPASLYALVQFQSVGMSLIVLAGFAALQIVISTFIYPTLLRPQPFALSLRDYVALAFWSWVWVSPGP